jgi:hypothetical protein
VTVLDARGSVSVERQSGRPFQGNAQALGLLDVARLVCVTSRLAVELLGRKTCGERKDDGKILESELQRIVQYESVAGMGRRVL